jgi:hypothetical protein
VAVHCWCWSYSLVLAFCGSVVCYRYFGGICCLHLQGGCHNMAGGVFLYRYGLVASLGPDTPTYVYTYTDTCSPWTWQHNVSPKHKWHCPHEPGAQSKSKINVDICSHWSPISMYLSQEDYCLGAIPSYLSIHSPFPHITTANSSWLHHPINGKLI